MRGTLWSTTGTLWSTAWSSFSPQSGSEVSKRGWREGVGDKQTPFMTFYDSLWRFMSMKKATEIVTKCREVSQDVAKCRKVSCTPLCAQCHRALQLPTSRSCTHAGHCDSPRKVDQQCVPLLLRGHRKRGTERRPQSLALVATTPSDRQPLLETSEKSRDTSPPCSLKTVTSSNTLLTFSLLIQWGFLSFSWFSQRSQHFFSNLVGGHKNTAIAGKREEDPEILAKLARKRLTR